jgi:hypothetical protein
MSTSRVRSLADELRGRSDEQLRALLTLRPDLLAPIPSDLSALAARAGSSPSVLRALDSLDRWSLQVLEAIAALGEDTNEAAVVAATDPAAQPVIERLIEMALVYRVSEEQLRLPSAVLDAIGSEPAGLGPITGIDTTQAAKILEEIPTVAEAVLDRLVWGPPRGSVGDVRHAGEGVSWLLEHRLLVPIDRTTVALPRELGIHLRGGRIHQRCQTQPPTLAGPTPEKIDHYGASAAATFLRWCEEILEAWSITPAESLRSGGLGVREIKRATALLDVDEYCAGFVIETLYAAGLIGPSGDSAELFMPTTAFDLWSTLDSSKQWSQLVLAWIATDRVAGFTAAQDEKRGAAPLGPELARPAAPNLRRGILEVLANVAPLAPTIDSLEPYLAWIRPRRSAIFRPQFLAWTLRESEWLGVTGRGAITSFASELLETGTAEALEPLMPAHVDHVLVQADLTAIAPGPLEPEVARELSLLADIESRGGATVYRFTENSLRRGLDSGLSSDEITHLLTERSKTPLPQSLTYLIKDLARRHGAIRIGAAGSYLRCDDEGTLMEVLADRRLASLRLRRLAPTLLISPHASEDVLDALREFGYAPAAESGDGSLLIRRPDARRSPSPLHSSGVGGGVRRSDGEPPQATDSLLEAAIRALRVGERASTAPRQALTPQHSPLTTSSETLAILREALQREGSLWIGFADPDGGVSQRIVDPQSIAGGILTAYDHTSHEIKRFPIHRITGVATV